MIDFHALLPDLIFYCFAILGVFSAAMVVLLKNPARSVLFLIVTFFATGSLWIMLEMDFLAITLMLVYVGAVMVLFLFVVMMLDIETAYIKEGFIRYLPVGILVMGVLLFGLIYAVGPDKFGMEQFAIPAHRSADYNQVALLGNELYTRYLYPFEVAGVLLLVAIIAAISLTFRGRRDSKASLVAEQLKSNKQNRLTIVKMKTDLKGLTDLKVSSALEVPPEINIPTDLKTPTDGTKS